MAMDLGAISAKIEIDDSKATKALESAQQALESLEKLRPEVTVGADTSQAEKELGAVESFLTGVLDGMRAEVSVGGDTDKAEAAIKAVEGMLNGLEGEKSTIEVDADTSAAESGLDAVADKAASAGDDAGGRMGDGMVAGVLAGLASIPIAGAVVKIGQSVAEGLMSAVRDGLGQEVSRDLFSARTGLDAATAAKFASAAGAAYGQAWGESVEQNLDVARDALQKGLLDPDATSASIEEFMAQMSAMSTLAQEEASVISTALDAMVSSGLSDGIESAMDALTVGLQQGVNSADDLFDTFTEYSVQFAALGLNASEAMGLLNQGLEGGARSADLVADALKEFSIRAVDASELSASAFEALGMDAEKMTAQFAAGGEGAKAGLQQVITAISEVEDETQRGIISAALFGTQWEDLKSAFGNLDVSSAVASLGDVEGALDAAMSVMGDNPATNIEEAMRNIELAMDGVKGALAGALEGPLNALADWATGNSAGILEAIQGWINGLFDFARAGVEVAATLTEAFGDFVSNATLQIAALLDGLSHNAIAKTALGLDGDALRQSAGDIAAMGFEIDFSTEAAAAEIMELSERIGGIQDQLNEGFELKIDAAEARDAAQAAAEAIGSIGEAVEDVGSVEFDIGGQFSTATADGAALHEQMLSVVDAMRQVQSSAAGAGESQASLTERFEVGRNAILGQLEALGMSREQAAAVAEAYGLIPAMIETSVYLDSAPAFTQLGDLAIAVDNTTGEITVNGNTTPANATLGELMGNVDAATGTVDIAGNSVPANMTLEQLLAIIGGSAESVSIDGNDYEGRQALGVFAAAVRGTSASASLGLYTGDAYSALRGFLNSIPSSVSVALKAIPMAGAVSSILGAAGRADGGAVGLAGGGEVRGLGGPRDDLVPAINYDTGQPFRLSNGEHVLTADDVADLGGQQGAYALRALIQAGMVKPLESARGLAGGGQAGYAPSSSPLAAPTGPATFHLYDSDGVLMGTMRGVAQHETGRAMATAVRRTR